MEMLKVEGLSKRFGGLQALSDVSFDAQSGEKLAIIGPNGAGKTTLFHLLGGQLSATTGRIFLQGQEITRLPPRYRLHLGLARSFQLNSLFFNLALIDNMLLALKGAERRHFEMFRPLNARNDLVATAQRLLESIGLWEMRFAPVATLSYGDQRLVEVIFALSSSPKLILLDEPTAGLSTAEANAFADTFRQLLKEQEDTSVIFCAHDMDLVFNLANRIMVLYFGQLVAQGTPQEIQTNPKVREIYLGAEDSE